ncbi:B3 domain-containing protein Os11g0156000-like [Typha latifolia]|uniref:B3 domain-containing protein Os11g0156000-like n=1 Tax=Typha latifolia TaxID=4733 RepID=UPI003C309063
MTTNSMPQAWPWEPVAMNSYHRYLQYHEEISHGYERERMFEKPLTPSDVGKLNRLVIPKQHAEKHFPLERDSSEKGLLLSFEDESGKPWRFRYSYWTSSQSYVLTKGWSRYVKEKRLDAGDVVLFERVRVGGGRLFIGCRRRGANDNVPIAAGPWGTSLLGLNSRRQDDLLRPGDQKDESAESTTTAPAPASSKRLRLFGVNVDLEEPCPPLPSVANYWRSS